MSTPKSGQVLLASVVVALGAAGCSGGHSRSATATTSTTTGTTTAPVSAPGTATAVGTTGRSPVAPGMKRAVRSGFSFDYPTRLRLDPVDVNEHYSTIVAYVSNQPLHDPCRRTPNSITCGRPLTRLAPDGVLVTWTVANSVGPVGNRLVDAPGVPRIVGGHDAKVDVVASASDPCFGIGASVRIDARIRIQAFVPSDTTLDMDGCLGPAAVSEQSTVLAMFDSVRFDAEPAAGSVSCPGTPPRAVPTRQRAGTVMLLVPDDPVAVLACRYHGFNQPQPVGSLAAASSLDVSTVVPALNAAVIRPRGVVSNCPADFSDTDVLWFAYARGPALMVEINDSGCRNATNGDRTVFTPPSVQLRLQAALGADEL
jgi:hypothetical protein